MDNTYKKIVREKLTYKMNLAVVLYSYNSK